MDLRQGSSDPFTLSGSLNGSSLASFGLRPIALVPSWVPDVAPSEGEDISAAGNGGNGTSFGVIDSEAQASFSPTNVAFGGAHSLTQADQGNTALLDQHSDLTTGIGGSGGSGNSSLGGDGGAHVGTGGNGLFIGALGSSNVGVFGPVNIAVAAGPASMADAHQANFGYFHQGTTQVAGIGGDGGNHNLGVTTAVGGTMPGFGGQAMDLIFTGDIATGQGGNGTFIGTMTDINVAIFSPINIAIAGAGGTARASQGNTAIFDQGATQLAGIGGHGGDFNIGGVMAGSSAFFTGHDTTGSGGNGHATGSMVDVDVGYLQPINIAVPALGEATALQLDHVLLDQHATQLAGIGGASGDDNFTVDHLLHA